jgi:hypothetical protein
MVWYTDESSSYLRLAWEAPLCEGGGEKAGAEIQKKEIHKGKGRGNAMEGREVGYIDEEGQLCSDILELLSIPPEKHRCARTWRRSSVVEVPLANLSLCNQLFLIWLFLCNAEGMLPNIK